MSNDVVFLLMKKKEGNVVMDKIFQEEYEHLEETEKYIDSLIKRHYDKLDSISTELNEFVSYDYDDVFEKRNLRHDLQQQKELVDMYRAYKPSPYFGRLDLEDESESMVQSIYVGKKGLTDGTKQVIVDWRSPVGEFFYVKTEKDFKYDNIIYSLLLRRSLQIENAQLIEYNTEYDIDNIELGGDVIDPFLLTVLKDKRRQNKLTDIIKTIQSNQNEIIRKPEKESFIVQGCAGSGKTMILLHRLSFLAFNRRYDSYKHIKIITPNRFFDMHINDLSRELGLDEIERLTVEEFYLSLMKAYSSKIKADAEVISEKTMGEDFLKEIYSIDFQNDLVSKYSQYWNDVLNELKTIGVFEIFSEYGILIPDNISQSISTYEAFKINITKILNNSKKAIEKVEELKERIENQKNRYSENEGKESDLLNNIKQFTKALLIHIDDIIAPDIKEEMEINSKSNSIKESIQTVKSNIKELEQVNATYLAQKSEVERLQNEKINIDMLDSIPDVLSDKIKESCIVQIKTLQDLYEDLKIIPIYNFAKRSRIKKNILVANVAFAQMAMQTLFDYKSELIDKSNEATQIAKDKQNELMILEKDLNALSNKQSIITEKCRKYILVKKAFESNDIPDLKKVVSEREYNEILPDIKEYAILYAEYTKLKGKKDSILESIESNQEDIINLKEEILSDEKRELLEKGYDIINKLSENLVFKNVFLKEMRMLYKAHKETYSKHNYRHKLYIRLLYCMLYFKRAIGLPTFINIDEAQDISLSEYKLLKAIMGENCTYNLYGDVNQLVYSYKGITDWEDVQNIISSQLYFLNENYRNTIQITEFCNKVFDADILPVGISGKEEEELNINQAISYILDKSHSEISKRNVIIYRNGVSSIRKELQNSLMGYDISWDEINDKKISIITVEQAKGIEFDNVVVVADQMTPNEKYISFTRAMDELIVVNDKFAENFEIDYIEEEIFDDDII